MFKFLFSLIGKVIVTLVVIGGAGAAYVYLSDQETPAPSLPNLPAYNTVESQQLTSFIGNLAEGATMLANQPELAQKAAVIDAVISCYQETGAVQAQLYSHKETPLSSGVVAIADRNAMLNPSTFFGCLNPAEQEGRMTLQKVKIEPCSANYTVSRDNNEYYILYAGTTAEICHDFCSQLEACVAHP